MRYKRELAENIKSGNFNTTEKFKTKKSLGQNFLNNENVLKLIADSANIKEGELILEIGPGMGALTSKLLEKVSGVVGAKLLCIEKDHRLMEALNEKFKEGVANEKINIIEEDILKWGSEEYFTKSKIKNFEYKIIANIPYYITGAIIEKFLEEKIKPSEMIFMVQKEVAQRITNKDGKGSILSLCTKYYADVEILKIVSKGSFTPAPKIDSAVIKITLKQKKLLDEKYLNLENKYLSVVKVGLSHKRKTLISNLKKSTDKDVSEVRWDNVFENLSIDKKIRGEDLDVDEFLKIVYNAYMV